MISEAKRYKCNASFGKPSLDSDSLSNIVTGLASSLTTSKTEMLDNGIGEAKMLRTDLIRERNNDGDEFKSEPTDDDDGFLDDAAWIKYVGTSVQQFWSWSYEQDDFVYIFDRRCEVCWNDTKLEMNNNVNATKKFSVPFLCPGCGIACFCSAKCYNTFKQKRYQYHDCSDNARQAALGNIVEKHIPSFLVAMKKKIFGEGAERAVHKFRFLKEDEHPLGKIMVAKESLFVQSKATSYEGRMDYHGVFMRTQAIAAEMAKKFNSAIDALVCQNYPQEDIKNMPRIYFLEPMVVEVQSPDGEEYNILVEPFLSGKYEKFTNNMGYVKDYKSIERISKLMENLCINEESTDDRIEELLLRQFSSQEIKDTKPKESFDLGVIHEDCEYASDEEDAIDSVKEAQYKDEDFPLAFSHFSYEMSKKKLMVVDLQGAFKINGDGTRCYTLTDPAIHSRRNWRCKWYFGKTDRGEKGMNAFFNSHKCNEVCKLLGLTAYDDSKK